MFGMQMIEDSLHYTLPVLMLYPVKAGLRCLVVGVLSGGDPFGAINLFDAQDP